MSFTVRLRKFIRWWLRLRPAAIPSLLLQWMDAFRDEDRATKRMDDAQFGPIWRNPRGAWRGKILFSPTDSEVSLYLRGGDDCPTDWHRRCFAELVRRYPELRKEMEVPLWTEYEEIRQSWDLECRALAAPEQIWEVASLFAIEINGEQSTSGIDLSLDHQIDWDNEDHDLNVFIKDWHVLEVAMEG